MKSYCNVSSSSSSLILVLVVTILFFFTSVKCEDPYRFFTWKVTYGDIYPLGIKQQVFIYIYVTVIHHSVTTLSFYVIINVIVQVLPFFFVFAGDLD
jgi:hypothetical protein